MACGQTGKILLTTAQYSSEGSGGHHRAQPVTFIPASQQGYTYENPKAGSVVYMVCR